MALEVERLLAEEARKKKVDDGKVFGGVKQIEEKTDNLFIEPVEHEKVFQKIEKPLIKNQPIHAAKDAAKLTGTSQKYVSDAKAIQKSSPEVAKAVVSGALNMFDEPTAPRGHF